MRRLPACRRAMKRQPTAVLRRTSQPAGTGAPEWCCAAKGAAQIFRPASEPIRRDLTFAVRIPDRATADIEIATGVYSGCAWLLSPPGRVFEGMRASPARALDLLSDAGRSEPHKKVCVNWSRGRPCDFPAHGAGRPVSTMFYFAIPRITATCGDAQRQPPQPPGLQTSTQAWQVDFLRNRRVRLAWQAQRDDR